MKIQHYISLIGPYVHACKKMNLDDNDTILSLTSFNRNEEYCRKYFPNKNFLYIDKEFPEILEDLTYTSEDVSKMSRFKEAVVKFNIQSSNIMTSVPPCGGLSMMNTQASADSDRNKFMYSSVKLYLASDSDVLVFENAPNLSSKVGMKVLQNIQKIIKDNGYTRNINIVQMNTMHHGIPQNRKRTFCFIYKGDILKLTDIRRETPCLKDFILEADKHHVKNDVLNDTSYSYYGESRKIWFDLLKAFPQILNSKKDTTFLCNLIYCGVTPDEFENCGVDFSQTKMPLVREYKRLYYGITQGKGVWDCTPMILNKKINAITSKHCLNYYVKDLNRFLSLREVVDLMGYPPNLMANDKFEVKFAHVITQNIPLNSAVDSLLWAQQLFEKKNMLNCYAQRELQNKILMQIQNDSNDFDDINFLYNDKYYSAKDLTASNLFS